MKTLLVITMLFSSVQPDLPADTLTLQYCYEQAKQHYPTARNIALDTKITDLNVRIVNTGYFPRVTVSGRASYQSEVTEFSTPGGGGSPAISKDQYEASLNVVQNIFSGGAVGIRKELQQARGEQELQNTKVELHQIRTQIDKVYYGILLSKKQAEANGLLRKNLNERLLTVRSRVKNGVLLKSQQHILEAELIKAKQDSTDISSNTKAGYQVLGELIGKEVPLSKDLQIPQISLALRDLQPQRAELHLFESTKQSIEQQKKLAQTNRLPSISAYGTAAFGRPGLNFLNDDFHDYYSIGLRLKWEFWDFNNAREEQQILQIQQQKITHRREAFVLQLNATLDRINERIASIRENIERDSEIIALRKEIVKESASQLENGVITATEYVTELTRANEARLSLLINEIRLSQAQTDYLTTLGISIKE